MRFVNPIRIVVGLATLGILAASGTSYAAGTASFALSPASTNVTEGDTTTVVIYEDGSNVNVVTATFSYDNSELQFVSDSCAGAFPSTAASSSSSISCYVPGGSSAVSGSNEVATLSFKTIATGTATVTVNGSQIASNGSNVWDGNPASTSITISAPAAPTQPTQSSSSSSSSNPGTSAASSQTTSKSSSSSKPTTSATSNPVSSTNTSPSSTGTSSTSSAVKGAATTTKKSGQTIASSTNKNSHTAGLVTSGVSILVLAAAAAYWFIAHKRTELAPAKVYKLHNDTESKAAVVVKPSSKKSTTQTKAAAAKKPNSAANRKTSSSKKATAKKSNKKAQ
ncbi:MAG TPA: cohesin domain-containing protein [Verrucomicrobiae bacterium]|nr:cohesin domain-containing protein [Verrucomicrobiae bacterium]